MRLMIRNSRTALLLTAILGAPLLASAIASRVRESNSLRTTIQASEVTAAGLEASRNLQPQIPPFASTPPTSVHFEVFKVQTRKSIREFETRLGKDAFAAMLKLNRIDRRHIHVGELLVIPNAPDTNADLMNTAPFPIQL